MVPSIRRTEQCSPAHSRRTPSPTSGTSVAGSEPIEESRVDCELTNELNVIIGFAELLVESDRLDARNAGTPHTSPHPGLKPTRSYGPSSTSSGPAPVPGSPSPMSHPLRPNLHNKNHIYFR